jgi:hypothetical protein
MSIHQHVISNEEREEMTLTISEAQKKKAVLLLSGTAFSQKSTIKFAIVGEIIFNTND